MNDTLKNLNNPQGRLKFAQETQGKSLFSQQNLTNRKVISVPDQTIETTDKEFEQAYQQTVMPQKSFPVKSSNPIIPPLSEAKERIKYLMGIGRSTTNVPVIVERETGNETINFQLKTLKDEELYQLSLQLSNIEGDNAIKNLMARRWVLFFSLDKIDGHSIEETIGSNNPDDKFEFISQLQDSLLDLLYQSFSELNNNNKKKFALKNPDELREEIKK